MKHAVLFVGRKPLESVSIERVFEQIAKDLPRERFETAIQTMPYGNSVLDILKNLIFFSPKPADIYHITGQVHYMALRLPKDNTVLTFHDLIFLHRRTGLRRYILKKLFLDLPLSRLDFVTAISQSTKDEIIKYTKCDPAKVRVILNPIFDGVESEPVKLFDEKCPLILQIGTAANKNVPNLIKALSGIECKLRIIGRVDTNINAALAETDIKVENVPAVDATGMVEEYRNADIIAFCSTYEGFGLPIIESHAMRKPVITSDISPMRDIAGNGACLVDPNDVSSIKNGILKLINDSHYREELIENGARNVLRFDAKKTAMQYADIYELILKK